MVLQKTDERNCKGLIINEQEKNIVRVKESYSS